VDSLDSPMWAVRHHRCQDFDIRRGKAHRASCHRASTEWLAQQNHMGTFAHPLAAHLKMGHLREPSPMAAEPTANSSMLPSNLRSLAPF
jgi:hypothetical protein